MVATTMRVELVQINGEEVVEAILAALAGGARTVRDVREGTGLLPSTVRTVLASPIVQGLVARDGVGSFQDPYRYHLTEQG